MKLSYNIAGKLMQASLQVHTIRPFSVPTHIVLMIYVHLKFKQNEGKTKR